MAFIESGQSFDRDKHRAKMKKVAVNLDRTKFTFRIPTPILKKFKKKLLEDGVTANDCINAMILKYIDKD